MIKKIASILSSMLIGLSAYAEGFHLDKVVSNGSWSITNSASAGWEVCAVTFKHSASCTNDFTLTRIRPFVIESSETVITTNAPLLVGFGLKDAVSTNVYITKSISYVTNVMFSASTTNVTTDIVYGEEALKYGWYIHPSDILKVDFSFTNNPVSISIDAE